MKVLGCAVAAAAVAIAGAALAAPDVVVNPDWLVKPRGEDIAEAYPPLAVMLTIEGRAVISCQVDAKGDLGRCEVVSESPKGLGFGQAALSISTRMKMKPKTVNGKPVDGGTVRVPLNFALPRTEDEPSRKAGAEVFGAPSARALELATKIVAAQNLSGQGKVQLEVQLMQLSDAKWPGVDDKTRDDAIAAMRAGYGKYIELYEAAIARSYAGAFSEAELTQIEAFTSSPAGRALNARQPAILESVQGLAVENTKAAMAAAKAIFCAQHACQKVEDTIPAKAPVRGDVPPPAPTGG